jgi:DamX protein
VDRAEPLGTVLSAEQVLKAENVETQATKVLEQKNVTVVKPSVEANEKKGELPRETLVEAPKDSTSDTVFAVLTALESSLTAKDVQITSLQSGSQSVKLEEIDLVEETNISANRNLDKQTVEAPEATELPNKSELIEQSAETKNQELDLSPTEWLLTQQDSVWAIQLLAVKDKSIANSFVLANEFKDVYVYETLRNNSPWWVVIQAPFANIDDARVARQKLPASVLAGQPFFKKFERIKQEIQQVTR